MMRTAVAIVIALSAGACASAPRMPEGPRADSMRTASLPGGAMYRYRWFANGPFAVHEVATPTRTCGIEFRTIKALDRRIGRERTSDMYARTADSLNVLAAINADFFSFDPPGVPEGPQIANGVLLKSEGRQRAAVHSRLVGSRPVFAVDGEGRPMLLHTRMRGSVQSEGARMPLAGVNVQPRNDSAFVFTSFWGAATPPDSVALEMVARNGVVVAVDTLPGGVAIPAEGFVIAVRGAGRAAFGNISVGARISWSAEFEGISRPRELIGGYPMLLAGGKHVHHDEVGLRSAFADERHPRAAIGIDGRGRVWLVAVDGRQPEHSAGMSLEEFGDFLLAHGIRDALNLDGGGSTTMLVNGRIVNRPSDTNGERAVANALLIIDQAGAASCARNK